jgi:ATP-binding cassette, subfamily B, bacterial
VRHLLRTFPYLRPYRGMMALSIVILVFDSAVGLLAPWMLTIVVDNVLGDVPPPPILVSILGDAASDPVALLALAVGGGLGLAIAGSALTVWNTYITTSIEQGMVLTFRSQMFRHVQRLSFAFHDRQRTGKLMYRINNSAHSVGQVPMMVPSLGQSVLTLVGMLLVTWAIDPPLALLSLVVIPALFLSLRNYVRRIEPRLVQVRRLEAQSLTIVHEAMAMLRVIASFGRERHEHRKFIEQGRQAVDARVGLTVRQTLFSLGINTITAVGTSLVIGYGALRVLDGQLSVGQLLVVLAYIAAVYAPLEAIAGAAVPLTQNMVQLRSAFGVLDTEPDILDAPDAVSLGRARGEVELRGVSFSYKGRTDTLEDVSFRARAGEIVAIVGPTGAGKSTLIGLLPRFYDARSGQVLIDGIDVRSVQVESLREQFAIVLQEPLLFSDTIAANIRYGRLDATDDEVVEAARAANAHDFIAALPLGYDTELGERGAMLSGGERQRIAVARAFLRDAPILLLDEPTSSIDSRTEQVILDALDRLVVGRTTFMIAHRLSTVRHADQILVLQGGRIVESGHHDELMASGGLYSEMSAAQAARGRNPRGAGGAPGASADSAATRAPALVPAYVTPEADR